MASCLSDSPVDAPIMTLFEHTNQIKATVQTMMSEAKGMEALSQEDEKTFRNLAKLVEKLRKSANYAGEHQETNYVDAFLIAHNKVRSLHDAREDLFEQITNLEGRVATLGHDLAAYINTRCVGDYEETITMLVSINEGTGDKTRKADIAVQVNKIQKFANDAQNLVESADSVIETIAIQDDVRERGRLSLHKNLHNTEAQQSQFFEELNRLEQPFVFRFVKGSWAKTQFFKPLVNNAIAKCWPFGTLSNEKWRKENLEEVTRVMDIMTKQAEPMQEQFHQVDSENEALLHLVKDLREILETSIRSPLQTAADETKQMKQAGDDIDELENACANVSDSLQVVRASLGGDAVTLIQLQVTTDTNLRLSRPKPKRRNALLV